MERIDAARIAETILAAPGWARVGITAPTSHIRVEAAFELAVKRITRASEELLAQLPPRQQPPKTLPPLRRIAARSA